MEIKCPKCETVYHLDENQIPSEGANVKCTNCHNIFRIPAPVVRPQTQVTQWHLKKPDGSIINFAHLGELQKLILEHKANLEDMISKDGISYKRLADMPEFAPLFIKRDQENIKAAEQQRDNLSKEPIQQKADERFSSPQVQSVVTPISIPHQDEEIDIYGRPKKKKKGAILILSGVAIIIIGLLVVFLLKDKLFGTGLTEEELSALKTASEEIHLLDYPNLERASSMLEGFMKGNKNPPKIEILALYTHSLILRGELLKLENFVAEKRIRELIKADKYSEVAKRLNDALNERQKLIQDISNNTMSNLKKLDMSYGSKPLAKYIALEYIRVQSIFDKSSADKGKAILKELKEMKEFQYQDRLKFVEGDLILKTGDGVVEDGIRLVRESANVEKGFVLPYFMLARFYISKGEYENALIEINNILSIYPSNSVANALKEHIDDLLNITKSGQFEKRGEEVKKEEQKGVEEREQKTEAKKEVESPQGKEIVGKEEKEDKTIVSKEKREEAVSKGKTEKTTSAEQRSSGNYSQLIKQAKQLASKGQIDKAADIFLQATELEPTLAEPFLLMGWMYIDAGKNEQAAQYFLRAIKLKGNKCDGYMGLGEAYKFMKRNSDAKKYYQMYLEQCPNGPDAVTARNNLNTLK